MANVFDNPIAYLADLTNLAACLLIVVATLLLGRNLGEAAEKGKTKGQQSLIRYHVVRQFLLGNWLLAWFFLFVFYVLRLFPWSHQALLLIPLSNLNSVFLLVAGYALLRGRRLWRALQTW